jgi:NAD(P)-dependent dehydrogenase (short-subunit alcohol dehydrogenase family)
MRSVVITGASTGIGEACARALDRGGWTVFAGVRRVEDGDRLRSGASDRLRPIAIDVTDRASIEAAREAVLHQTDRLDGLVNNAGVAVAGPLECIPIDDFRRQLEINVVGQIAVTQAFLPLVRRAAGRVVLMGSIGGRMSTPFLGPYCASKFALEAIADALRVELMPWNVHVAIVEPGSIATPIWTKSADAAAAMRQRMPPDTDALYGEALTAVGRAAESTGRRGVAPALVADAVSHALEAPRPRTRYLVGSDARIRGILGKFIPDRMRDRLLIKVMGLPIRSSRQ